MKNLPYPHRFITLKSFPNDLFVLFYNWLKYNLCLKFWYDCLTLCLIWIYTGKCHV